MGPRRPTDPDRYAPPEAIPPGTECLIIGQAPDAWAHIVGLRCVAEYLIPAGGIIETNQGKFSVVENSYHCIIHVNPHGLNPWCIAHRHLVPIIDPDDELVEELAEAEAPASG